MMRTTDSTVSEQELLNILFITNGRFADVVESNGRNGVRPQPPKDDEFRQMLEAAYLEFERATARKSAENAKQIASLRRELMDANLTLENVAKERDNYRQKDQKCTETNERLARELQAWSQKCDAEVSKTMTLQQTLEEEKRVSTRQAQSLEDVKRRFVAASKYKEEGDCAERIETERFLRLIAKLKGLVETHGTGTGKPCDPAIFDRKLQRVIEAVRSDCGRKFEEFRKKYEQLKRLEPNQRVKIREMEIEKANMLSEVMKLRSIFTSLEKESQAMQRTISGLKQRINELETLRAEVEKLRMSIDQIVEQNVHLVTKYGLNLQSRARLQNGLNEYENLVIVEENRISEMEALHHKGGSRSNHAHLGRTEVVL